MIVRHEGAPLPRLGEIVGLIGVEICADLKEEVERGGAAVLRNADVRCVLTNNWKLIASWNVHDWIMSEYGLSDADCISCYLTRGRIEFKDADGAEKALVGLFGVAEPTGPELKAFQAALGAKVLAHA